MIGYLQGVPVIQGSQVLLIVNGVGYRVNVGLDALAAAQQTTELELFIHTHAKEDALELYGFKTNNQRDIFELLLSVSGVGPRTALALTELGVEAIIKAVQQADVTAFTQVPRVGKKLAQKIIIDLKSKLGDLQELNLGPSSPIESDVQAALISLGYSDTEIQRAVSQLDLSNQDPAFLVKQAIKILTIR